MDPGEADAICALAKRYQFGDGVDQDVRQSVVLYERAISEFGHGPSMFFLAHLLQTGGEGLDKDPARSVSLYQRVINEFGRPSAMSNLAVLLKHGADGVEKDPARAVQLYEEAIQAGNNKDAKFNLGNLLLDGDEGVEKDPGRAVELYKQVVEGTKDPGAMYNLANVLSEGTDGVEQDASQALDLYEQVIAETGLADATVNLGILLWEGADGVNRNVARARDLLERAISEVGDVRAKFNLACLLSQGGPGVTRDLHRSAKLYESAIVEGGHVGAMVNFVKCFRKEPQTVDEDSFRAIESAINASENWDAINCLANLIIDGAGFVKPNAVKAATLYERAIDQGNHVPCLFNLGKLLSSGAEGLKKDLKRAVGLFEEAIDSHGHVGAMVELAVLLQEDTDGVEKDCIRAVDLNERAIKMDADTDAMFNLAHIFLDGREGVEVDAFRATELYEDIIELTGNADAMYNLATVLHMGKGGVPVNKVGALTLYERAILKDAHTPSMCNLALMLRTGADDVQRDVPRAISLFQRAIDIAGEPHLMIFLATVLLSNDIGPLRDAVRAKILLEEAIGKSTYPAGFFELAVLLKRGDDGVRRDTKRATELFRLAKLQTDSNNSRIHFGDFYAPQVQAGEDFNILIERNLRAARVRPRQCFLIVLGGSGRGKTSTVRSLRGIPFVQEHAPTILVSLNRWRVLPDGRHLGDHELDQLAFNTESLTANLSRARHVYDETTVSEQQSSMPVDNLDSNSSQTFHEEDPRNEATQMSDSLFHVADASSSDTSGVSNVEADALPRSPSAYEGTAGDKGNELAANVQYFGSQSTLIEALAKDFSSFVPEKVRSALTENPFPVGFRGALIQCWDFAGETQYIMAHALFLRFSSVLVFAVNLEDVWYEATRLREIRELCKWIQLAFALVRDPESAHILLVGTRKAACDDVGEMWNILQDGLMHELGDAPYDTWIKEGSNQRVRFLALENSCAMDNPSASGLKELEDVLRDVADDVVETRTDVPAHWVAFIEELEQLRVVFLTRTDIVRLIDGFPGFHIDRGVREEEAMSALQYYRGVGRVVLFEVSETECYVFMDPSRVLDFIRRITAPSAPFRLRRRDGKKLRDDGLLTHDGLAILWDGHSAHVRAALLDLLCKFDILIRLKGPLSPGKRAPELIGVPSFLPKISKGFPWAPKPGEIEIRLKTKFRDTLPPGLIGSLIASLHRTVGGEQTLSGNIGPDAAILSVTLWLMYSGRVCVAFDDLQRHLSWTVRAKEPLIVVHACLRAIDLYLTGPLRNMPVECHHCISCNCQNDPHGCGGSGSVDFELPESWTSSERCQSLGDLRAICSCRKPWTLFELMPNLSRHTHDGSQAGRMFMRNEIVQYDVFISHAGAEKWLVAYPVRDALAAAGLNVFIDEEDIGISTMTSEEQIFAAMRGSKVAIFILSPNFLGRKWPMRELRYFLELREAASEENRHSPVLIPLFYGLQVEECKNTQLPLSENYFQCFYDNGFFERLRECSILQAMEAVGALARFPGIRNDGGESDEEYILRAAAKIISEFGNGEADVPPTMV